MRPVPRTLCCCSHRARRTYFQTFIPLFTNLCCCSKTSETVFSQQLPLFTNLCCCSKASETVLPQLPLFTTYVATHRARRTYFQTFTNLCCCSKISETYFHNLTPSIYQHLVHRAQRPYFHKSAPLFNNIWCTEHRDRIFTNLLLCLPKFGAQSSETVFSQIYFSVY